MFFPYGSKFFCYRMISLRDSVEFALPANATISRRTWASLCSAKLWMSENLCRNYRACAPRSHKIVVVISSSLYLGERPFPPSQDRSRVVDRTTYQCMSLNGYIRQIHLATNSPRAGTSYFPDLNLLSCCLIIRLIPHLMYSWFPQQIEN